MSGLNITAVLVIHNTRFENVTIHSPVKDVDPLTGSSITTGLVRFTEEDEVGVLAFEDRDLDGKEEWRLFL